MAEKLSIQIALEGGAEIERQLEGIGEAGQKAFEDIAKSAEQVGGFKNLKPEEVTAKLKEVGIVGTAAFDKIKTAVANASRMERLVVAVQSVENALAKAGQAVASFISRFGVIAFVAVKVGQAISKAMSDAAKSINETADAALKLGVSIQKLDELRLAFEQAGISAKGVTEILTKIQGQFDQFQVGKIKTAFSELEEAAKRGFGAQGTEQLKILEEAAKGTGKAAEEARKALEKLGLPVPESASEAIRQLGEESKDAATFARDLALKLREMPPGLERDALAMQSFGAEFTRVLNAGGIAVDQFIAKLTPLSDAQVKAATELEQAQNRVAAAWQRLLTDPSWEKFKNLISSLFDPAFNLDLGIWDAFKSAGVAAMDAIKSAINATVETMNALITAINDAMGRLAQLIGLGQAVGSPSINPEAAHASGGLLGGRGSGTSDSNLAWVSRGEHIMPARAVAQPGVLAFLEALRRSGGNLRNVLDGMGRFALGGPVALPAFAGGGLNSMSNVTIQFPGVQPIGGLRAPADVVEELRKAAAMAQVRSGGRKPSRYS